MPPEIYFIFRLGQIFGFMPFSIRDRRLVFKWFSRRTLHFLLVASAFAASYAFVIRAFLLAFTKGGLPSALMVAPWVAGLGSVVVAQVSIIGWRRHLMTLINEVSRRWENRQKSGESQRFSVTKTMWKVHLFWFVQAAVFPAVTVAIFHWLKPTNDVFLSSLFCSADSDCPAQFLVPSMLVHNVTLLYAYFAILIFDVLPMCNAFAMTRGMKMSTDHLLEHKQGQCSLRNCPNNNEQQLSHIEYLPKSGSNKQIDIRLKTEAVRTAIGDHVYVQEHLRYFNLAFAPFILVSISQNFIMCIGLFFGFVILTESGNDELFTMFMYIGNGIQYLIRGSIVFSSFGALRTEACRFKSVLLVDLDLSGQLSRHDPTIALEVQLFIASLDEVFVQAGPYLNCTHSFLFSFYGILATYIAILYQSI